MSAPSERSLPDDPATLLAWIDAATQRAQMSGALHPHATHLRHLEDGGVRFVIRSGSAELHKAALATLGPAADAAPPRPNPFLPPEPVLTLCELAPHHRVLLNKFPVLAHHLLIVTRDFVSQDAPIEAGDFAALARLMRISDGLAFYNGGHIAGASQAHRHLQWLPGDSRDPEFLPMWALFDDDQTLQVPFRHARTSLKDIDWQSPDTAGQTLTLRYRQLLTMLDLPERDPMPPYNLLLTRRGMLLVARSAERWQGISLNALGFAGSLYVRDRAGLEALRAAGPMAALRAVSL